MPHSLEAHNVLLMPISPRLARLESLETRTLFSITLVDGTLQIEGTRRSDVIDVAVGVISPSRILVSVNGVGETFRAKSVTRIVIIAGLGDDTINQPFYMPPRKTSFDVNRPTTILGGGGNDYISGTLGTSLIDGGDGDDNIAGNSVEDSVSTLRGGAGDDVLFANFGRNILEGGAGADKIIGSDGDDVISGGPGNDNIDGTGGHDTITGDNGNDTLTSGDGKGGIIEGGRGDDEVIGNRTATLFGNAGKDTFRAYFLSSVKDAETGETVTVA